jgi:molybdenum cofactor cytidylyltransferase
VTLADDIHVILLGAGFSARMGGTDKRLLDLHGEPLLRRSARLYLGCGWPVSVVLRDPDPLARVALDGLDVAVIVNPDAAAGQQTSVMAGLAAAPLDAMAEGAGVLIALADQPLLTRADLADLAAARPPGMACVPRHQGRRGNPVILPTGVARRLRDAGTPPRAWLDANPASVAWFEAANDHFTRDLDTPEQAALLLARAEPMPD